MVANPHERRRNYRVSQSPVQDARIEIVTDDAPKVVLPLQDLSVGGAGCQPAENDMQSGGQVANVALHLPQFSHPLLFRGLLKRTQPSIAVAFSAQYASPPALKDSPRVTAPRPSRPAMQHHYLGRLRNLERFSSMPAEQRRATLRSAVDAAFSDVLSGLKPGERWWFRFVVDVLNSTGRLQQPGLLTEYLRLCRTSSAITEPARSADTEPPLRQR